MVTLNLNISNYYPFGISAKVQAKFPGAWNEVPANKLFDLFVLLPQRSEKMVRHAIISMFIHQKYIAYIPKETILLIENEIEKLANETISVPVIKSFKHGFKTLNFSILGKEFKIKLPVKKEYFLPEYLLADVTTGEMAFGLKKAILYQNKGGGDKAMETLNEFVATFCRPRKTPLFSFKTQMRPEFNTKEVMEDAAAFSSLSILHKLFVHQYVLGSLDVLKKAPKLKILFPTPKKEDENAPKKAAIKSDPNIWVDFIVGLSESKLLGSMPEVEKTPFQTALYVAAKKQQDIKDAERQRIVNKNKK